jgi:hypothetical protein
LPNGQRIVVADLWNELDRRSNASGELNSKSQP